jgi:hypothetical protein
LERRESPLYLCNSTLGHSPATKVPISYFLASARGQVRFDVGIGSVISSCCWQS